MPALKMVAVDVLQGSPEWLEWRARGISATDITVILGLSDYKTPWRLWAEKTGRLNPEDMSGNPHIERGNRLEDGARQLAEKRYNEILLPICAENGDWPVLRASFDGLDSNNIPHEFKAPADSTWSEIQENKTKSKTYKMYATQVEAQCVVAGNDNGRLFFFLENGTDMEFPIKLTDSRKAEILDRARWFWNLIETDTPPPMDPARDLYIPGCPESRWKWDANADAWRMKQQRVKALEVELKRLKQEQKQLQSAFVSQMGQFMSTDTGGVKITRFRKNGNIDYQSFLQGMFPYETFDTVLEGYRKPSREEMRLSLSEDELVNPDEFVVVTEIKAGYF